MGLFTSTPRSVASSSVGSLFNRDSAAKAGSLKLDLEATAGIFYDLHTEEGVPAGHALFKINVKAGELTRGQRIPLSGFFQAYILLQEGQRVGFNFVSQFQTENQGGYLVTFVSKAAGKATQCDTVVKTEDMVVFNYPNRGTLVISPRINESIDSIFQEQ